MQKNSKSEPFSDDAQENLRLENLFLQMKLKAEWGGDFGNFGDLPPQVTNEFLRNVIAIEEDINRARPITVAGLLGNPEFTKSSLLPDDALPGALENLMNRLKEKNIRLDFRSDCTDRVKYEFITEELFEFMTEDIVMPGLIRCFSYEEFHPDHKSDILKRARKFMEGLLRLKMDEFQLVFDDPFVIPSGRMLTRDQALEEFQKMIEPISGFEDWKYNIASIEFELKDENERGLGFAEGMMEFVLTKKDHAPEKMSGPFKIYLALENGRWSIFYFVLPGFKWDEKT
jgi:hypothetical protein